jgi:hypothetical protein
MKKKKKKKKKTKKRNEKMKVEEWPYWTSLGTKRSSVGMLLHWEKTIEEEKEEEEEGEQEWSLKKSQGATLNVKE